MLGLAMSGVFVEDGAANNTAHNIHAYIGAISGQPVGIPAANGILAGKIPGNAEKDALARAIYMYINELTPPEFDRLYKENAARSVAYDGVDALFCYSQT
jgi:hypothetical protein